MYSNSNNNNNNLDKVSSLQSTILSDDDDDGGGDAKVRNRRSRAYDAVSDVAVLLRLAPTALKMLAVWFRVKILLTQHLRQKRRRQQRWPTDQITEYSSSILHENATSLGKVQIVS